MNDVGTVERGSARVTIADVASTEHVGARIRVGQVQVPSGGQGRRDPPPMRPAAPVATARLCGPVSTAATVRAHAVNAGPDAHSLKLACGPRCRSRVPFESVVSLRCRIRQQGGVSQLPRWSRVARPRRHQPPTIPVVSSVLVWIGSWCDVVSVPARSCDHSVHGQDRGWR